MDYLVASMVAFIGATFALVYMSQLFGRKEFEIYFFAMAMISLMCPFVILMAYDGGISVNVETINNTTYNVTTTSNFISGTSGVTSGFFRVLLTAFLFSIAVFFIYFIIDCAMFIYQGYKARRN